jgi:hypothetical protein
MIRHIFIYWAQGFVNAPEIVKKCLLSWKIENTNWKIIELDDTNLKNYIDLDNYINNIRQKNITKTALSDIIRILLILKHGGVWCDATTFCNKPLDHWLEKYTNQRFWGFEKPRSHKLISSWFLYGEKKSYIAKRWAEYVIKYWEQHNKMHIYSWFHELFGIIYNEDAKFKNLWDSIDKIWAGSGNKGGINTPHMFVPYNTKLLSPLNQNIKKIIDQNDTPMYKLTYKYNRTINNNKSILHYIISLNDLRFIHIPKTGGTSIEDAAHKIGIKWGRYDKRLNGNGRCSWHTPQKIDEKLFCVIRNPYDRLISQFYHENEIKDYTITKLNTWISRQLKLYKEDIHLKGNHYLPQIYFTRHCDEIIRFDDLQNNLNRLMNKYQLPQLILGQAYGGSIQKNKRDRKYFCRLLKKDINVNNIKLINTIYAEDIKLWNKYQII